MLSDVLDTYYRTWCDTFDASCLQTQNAWQGACLCQQGSCFAALCEPGQQATASALQPLHGNGWYTKARFVESAHLSK